MSELESVVTKESLQAKIDAAVEEWREARSRYYSDSQPDAATARWDVERKSRRIDILQKNMDIRFPSKP